MFEGDPKMFTGDDNGDVCDTAALCRCQLELAAVNSGGLCLHPVILCTYGRSPV